LNFVAFVQYIFIWDFLALAFMIPAECDDQAVKNIAYNFLQRYNCSAWVVVAVSTWVQSTSLHAFNSLVDYMHSVIKKPITKAIWKPCFILQKQLICSMPIQCIALLHCSSIRVRLGVL
jgi:hypothetical protein